MHARTGGKEQGSAQRNRERTRRKAGPAEMAIMSAVRMCKCACRHCRCDCHTLEDAIAGPLADHLWRDYKATEIADAVAEHYTITTAQIMGPSRRGKVAR